MDQTPRGVHAALLSQGIDLCSVRSMYRILGESEAVRERRPLRSHERAPVPRLVARAPMTSKPLSAMLAELGFERSHARPRTSNDNAFSESEFKTLKYGPMWPSEPLFFDRWNARNPERLVKGRALAHEVPPEVWINRPLKPFRGKPGYGAGD